MDKIDSKLDKFLELEVASHFPEIENILQTENLKSVEKSFSEIHSSLETVSGGRGGFGKSQNARKVMKSLERTLDLLKELLKMKQLVTRDEVSILHKKK